MFADRIKQLRECNNLTQAQLARKLGITRASVNAWEMGISVPSTQYVVELAEIFKVSTDYLLGVNSAAALSVADLSEDDVALVYSIVLHLKNKKIGEVLFDV